MVPSANSPSEEEEEDSDMDESESGTSEDSDGEENVENVESPIRSVIGLDGLRKFVLPLMWMVNDFKSTIKIKHFDTLRERYQIPIDIPIHLPFKFEKCYYDGTNDVDVYEKMFKARFRLPLSALHHHLLQYLGLSVTQIAPNAWRIFLGAEVLYVVLTKGRCELTMEEFFHCYRPSEIFKFRGIYSFLPRKLSLRLVYETLDSNKNWKNRYFFIQRDNWICHPDERENMPLVDRTWGIMPRLDRPKVNLEQWSFLERIFKISLKERTWQKLITLDTLN
nr:hypothetical protein CFP56_55177 [Quercus suber]